MEQLRAMRSDYNRFVTMKLLVFITPTIRISRHMVVCQWQGLSNWHTSVLASSCDKLFLL